MSNRHNVFYAKWIILRGLIMKSLKLFFFFISFASFSFANFLSIGESGEMLNKGNYRVGASLQNLSAGRSGLNIGTFVDSGISDDMSARFLFGVGSVDFHLGGSLKYIPFPDFENQPAIGIKASAWLARIADTSTTAIQLAPLISKKVDIKKVELTPYFSVPVNFVFTKSNSQTGTQFVVGTEYQHPELENVLFAGEVALNLNNSESGFAIFASIPFDASKGLHRRSKKE